MAKDRESVTLDKDINEGVHKEAKVKRLGFSTLVNIILGNHLKSKGGEKTVK